MIACACLYGGLRTKDLDGTITCALCGRIVNQVEPLPYVSLSVLEGKRHQGNQSAWDAEQRARYRAEHREQLRAASLRWYYKDRDAARARKEAP